VSSSGTLARNLAAALGLPEAVATTSLKALRNENMTSMSGRGTSAAEMTKEDAATLLTAIASGAVFSQMADVTKFLLQMPQVNESKPARVALDLLRPISRFYSLQSNTTLRDGLLALLDRVWETDLETEADGAQSRHYDPLAKPENLTFTVGMDGMKRGGFATIRAQVSLKLVVTRRYSTWPMSAVNQNAEHDPLRFFDTGATFMSISVFNGGVFNAAISSLHDPVKKSRFRMRRLARSG
jgi:hypothetical protein